MLCGFVPTGVLRSQLGSLTSTRSQERFELDKHIVITSVIIGNFRQCPETLCSDLGFKVARARGEIAPKGWQYCSENSESEQVFFEWIRENSRRGRKRICEW